MTQIGTMKIAGDSGKAYEFTLYPWGSRFKPGHAAVYVITNRHDRPKGAHGHKKLYIGESDDLATTFADHPARACLEEHDANCIAIHQSSSATHRHAIAEDLLAGHAPVCNS